MARYHTETHQHGHQVFDRRGPCFGLWSTDPETCNRWTETLNEHYDLFRAQAELVRRRIDRDMAQP